jgi:ArpU family phage transcriptional regulator
VKIKLSENFDLRETRKKVNDYFEDYEKMKMERARLNVQKGLIAKYEASEEDKSGAYVATGKDEFNLSAIENKDEELEKHMSGYHWAKSILSEQEQHYIIESFINRKYDDEIIGQLGFYSPDSLAYKRLKRQAVYKFAYVLDLVA